MTNIRMRIPFEDLPNTRRLVALCQVSVLRCATHWSAPLAATTLLGLGTCLELGPRGHQPPNRSQLSQLQLTQLAQRHGAVHVL